MKDEMTKSLTNTTSNILDSAEAVDSARRLEEQRRKLIEERWLSTHVLAVHLEIESMLGTMLRQTLPKPKRLLDRPGVSPTFAQKLTLCDALDLLDNKLVVAIRALNRLRNSYAHTPNPNLPLPELVRFLAAVHEIHPITYQQNRDATPVELRTNHGILAHFEANGTENLEGMLFIALRLLRANLALMFTDEPPGTEHSSA